jgi:hypothetical protein
LIRWFRQQRETTESSQQLHLGFDEQGYPHVVFCDAKILCRNMEGELVCLSVQN